MTHLIDKSALVAGIKSRISDIKVSQKAGMIKKRDADKKILLFKSVLSLIDTLEVKEVDLEDAKKEELAQKYIDYTFKRHNIDPYSKEGQLIYYAYMHGINQCLTQLRAQKGE